MFKCSLFIICLVLLGIDIIRGWNIVINSQTLAPGDMTGHDSSDGMADDRLQVCTAGGCSDVASILTELIGGEWSVVLGLTPNVD